MKFVIALVVVAAAVSAIGEAASGSETMREGTDTGGTTRMQSISPPVAWESGFPLPAGTRRNESLGGATSLAPGKNFTIQVYDTDIGIESTNAFYAHHLPAAKRVREGQEVRFLAAGGHVKLAPLAQGTRITLVIGPR